MLHVNCWSSSLKRSPQIYTHLVIIPTREKHLTGAFNYMILLLSLLHLEVNLILKVYIPEDRSTIISRVYIPEDR